MAIDPKLLTHFTVEDLKKFFELDGNKDGQVSEEDLIPIYGQKVVDEYFAELSENITNQNWKKMNELFSQMKGERDDRLNHNFAKMFSDCSPLTKPNSMRTLQSALDVMSEEGLVINELFLHNLSTKTISVDYLGSIETPRRNWVNSYPSYLLGANYLYSKQIPESTGHDAKRTQSNYADIEARELRQSEKWCEIEQKYDIDIRLSDVQYTDEDFAILDGVISDIKQKRPTDFSIMKVLTIKSGGGGTISVDNFEVIVPNPLNESDLYHFGTGDYSADWRIDQEPKDIFSMLIAHELGHLIQSYDSLERNGVLLEEVGLYFKEGMYSNSWLDYPLYDDLLPKAELFPEDYRIFLSSNGTQVASQNISGEEYQKYEERLAFMKANFPLHEVVEKENE